MSAWKSIVKDGRPALRSPSGRIYYGTPSEVRNSALMPWHRKALADSLKLQRFFRDKGMYTADEFRACCAGYRRDMVRQNGGVPDDALVEIPAREYIMLCAGSRLVRNGVKDFFAELWRSEIEALLDIAEAETGRREIPLNRYERAALARCEAAEDTTSNTNTEEDNNEAD